MKKRLLPRYLLTTMLILTSSVFMVACGKQENVSSAAKEEATTEISTDISSTTVIEAEEATEEVVEETEPIVYFSSKSGFYDNGFSLELRCPIEDAVIYYTTDGTIPDETSQKYEGPISLKDRSSEKEVYAARTDYCSDSQYVPIKPITKCNIIRAIAYFADGTSSIVTNGSYFIGLDREALYGDAPVISLITDPENLFNEETGIFILGKTYQDWLAEDPANAEEESYRVHGNFSNRGKDWERPVAFEYIPATGKNVAADMGLRIKGASTRTYMQKSMRLIAREEYGAKSIKADLIPDNMTSDGSEPIAKYKSFVLRNGGNDNGFGKLRDPLLQKLVSDRELDTQQSTPCVVFLDGEYWGLYAITEDYTDNYIETHYGIDSKNVVIVKSGKLEEGNDEDISLYEDLYSFVTENDMTDASNYEQVKEMLDIPGFIDMFAISLYIYNHDSVFDDNNWSIWRTREADNKTPWSDGKWRVLLFDTEFSTGVYSGGQDFGDNNLEKALDESLDKEKEFQTEQPALKIFRSLYKNDEFRHDFMVTLCDLRNYNYEKTRAVNTLNEMAVPYQKLAGDSFFRYGPDWVVMWGDPSGYYESKIKELASFINGRYLAFPELMQDTFDLEAPVSVNITVSDSAAGDVVINNTHIDFANLATDKFSGKYFTEYDITLTAAPKDGHKFEKWIIDGATVSDETSESVTITLTGDCTIKAQYN